MQSPESGTINHENPVNAVYTLMRGIEYDGEYFYGPQKIETAQISDSIWQSEYQKSVAADYKTGAEIPVDTNCLDVISEFLTVCHGRLAECAGNFIIQTVQPNSPVLSFTDDDILSTEERSFTPFLGLSETVNGISATYPSPEDGWQNQSAPPLISTELEAEDDNRRLLSDVQLPFCPFPEQVQRLMSSALAEAQKSAKTHIHIVT